MHIYDRRYPAAEGASLAPPDALVPAYLDLQRRLGLTRCVVVNPSTYGIDNRCTVEAMHALRDAGVQTRGVAVLPGDVDDARLERLHAAGMRGVRFNQTLGSTSLDDLEPLAQRIAPLGWHVEILLPADQLVELESRLARLPVDVVFDHFGRLPSPGIDHPGHQVLLRLLRAGKAWVKASGTYLALGGPLDPIAGDMARACLDAAPDRVVWGSNWPHPSALAGRHPMPDDIVLLQAALAWCGDEDTVHRLFVHNPSSLYDF